MNAGMKALLTENLKKLRLSTMIRNLEALIRQAKQDSRFHSVGKKVAKIALNLGSVSIISGTYHCYRSLNS
jgi:hypothetical protein